MSGEKGRAVSETGEIDEIDEMDQIEQIEPVTPIDQTPDTIDSDVSDSEYEAAVVVRREIPWLYFSQSFAINLIIPFLNGLMLGFGEILAHEIGAARGWREAKVYDPTSPPVTRRRRWLFPF